MDDRRTIDIDVPFRAERFNGGLDGVLIACRNRGRRAIAEKFLLGLSKCGACSHEQGSRVARSAGSSSLMTWGARLAHRPAFGLRLNLW
jgi:hypothetical protein